MQLCTAFELPYRLLRQIDAVPEAAACDEASVAAHGAGDDDDDDDDDEAPRLTVRGPWAFFRGCGGVFLSS